MLNPMANPPDPAGPVSSGPISSGPISSGQRRRRSARREQGPPQASPTPEVKSSPDTPAEPRVRLDRLERKRARKPRRGSAEPAVATADQPPGPNTREGRRSRHRIRGQQAEVAADSPQVNTAAVKDPPLKTAEARQSRAKHAEPNHVEPPIRSPERAREVENLPRTARDRRNELAERALRGLVTTRGTQVSWSAALRARDVASPTDADMAEAERDLVIVRRNYTPPEPLPTSRKGAPEQRQERPARRGQRQSGKGF